jgi:dTDP-4-amino-4,6-dideoxygalactose transaminase
VKAGLRPRLVDVSPETLDYAPDELKRADFSRVLAIVATNLYGLPSDLPAISRLARQKHVFLIDDAAQAMGGQVGGRWCGTWGDAGLFSLDKGKNVSAIDGGIVVTNSDAVAAALADELKSASTQGLRASAVGAVKALVYWLFLRPWLYWIPNAIPQLQLGTTVYTTAFGLGRPPRALVALAAVMLERLDEFTCARAVNASALSGALMRVTGVEMIRPASGAAAVHLRLPVLFDSCEARQLALDLLREAGLGASQSYPSSLADVPELQHRLVTSGPVVGGRSVASRILTLPTHPFVRDRDILRAVEIIARCTGRLPEEAAIEPRRKQVDLVKL